jgi:glycosyltransferase involved in cell wall biosynthesis
MSALGSRIVFIQYANPAYYPPLEHASRILAEQGWQVIFLSATLPLDDNRVFPPHERIEVRRFPAFGGGLARWLNFVAFILWVVVNALRFRPQWIYASEIFACPAALATKLLSGCNVAYHEHDMPTFREPGSFTQRVMRMARHRLARLAELCILPQEQRLLAFVAETRRRGPTLCVHNCPRREEVKPSRVNSSPQSGKTTFYYHGSVNGVRLPLSILDALARAPNGTHLLVVGYETVGSVGYMKSFLNHAVAIGVHERVRYLGALRQRADILAAAEAADVGLAFMPASSDDINMRHMAGASNKPFDYMAVGLMLLVSDLPEWRQMFVKPGYARACNPADAASIAEAMTWCVSNSRTVRRAGEMGRQKILNEWNYESEFAPVAQILIASSRG